MDLSAACRYACIHACECMRANLHLCAPMHAHPPACPVRRASCHPARAPLHPPHAPRVTSMHALFRCQMLNAPSSMSSSAGVMLPCTRSPSNRNLSAATSRLFFWA